ncbi:hypothetical protein FB451DRAFT_1227841 [Mycena latifolia]|nr:hypothetical protein FB451DRAFT_1227841 [Mycena latifolia]
MADLASLLDTWFKRAGSRALSVFLPEGHNPEVMAVIRRYAHQLQDLELCCDNREDLFERDVQSLPFLKTLKITGEAEGFTCSTAGTIAMLRACPALVKFTLEQVFYPLADFYHETEILVLPHLQYLKFHGNEHILRYVTLPALQKLFIPFLDPRCVVLDLVQLFRRSAAPVHTLVVDDLRRRGWTPQETQECLSLLPKLAHFTLVDPLDASMDHLITALADASNLLPNLSKLQVRLTHPRGPLGAWYHKLPGVLAARRTQIRTVRIVWKRGLLEKPSEEVAVNLRQLVADGMEIHIGTTDGNLI